MCPSRFVSDVIGGKGEESVSSSVMGHAGRAQLITLGDARPGTTIATETSSKTSPLTAVHCGIRKPSGLQPGGALRL